MLNAVEVNENHNKLKKCIKLSVMYIILYAFTVKVNQEKQFVESWKAITNLIYEYEGSLGSRLHKKESQYYIAYAQWPSKHKFESSGKNLPKEASHYRNLMRASCEKVEILQKLEVIEDLLKENQND